MPPQLVFRRRRCVVAKPNRGRAFDLLLTNASNRRTNASATVYDGGCEIAGCRLAATALADPGFAIAVGMASQEQHLALRVVLLVLWNLLYQAPLVAVLVAAVFGTHEQLVMRVMEGFGPRRRALQTTLAVLLALVGLAVLGDGIIALLGEHVPWLRQLLLLR